MTRTKLILAALAAGIAIGVGLRWAGNTGALAFAQALLPIGQMWVRALQMTLIPLIFAMVARGVAQAVDSGRGGRLIGTTLGVFLVIMIVTVILCTGLTETALHLWPLPPNALAGLIDDAPPAAVPGFAAQILAIIPDNPIAAAAQGQIFPLVIFGVAFGAAIARLPRTPGAGEPAVLLLLTQIATAMLTIVEWVLVFAPVGIFVLAVGLGLSSGIGAAHVLGMFVALSFATSILMAGLCYVAIRVTGAGSIARFAAAIAPAQAMAAGTCSSVATTPVMIETAVQRLRIPEPLVGLVIPMAVSVFRLGTVAHAVAAVLVAAHAVGIEPTPVQLVLAGFAVILGSISGAGLPGAAVIYAIYGPGLQLLGAPMAIMPLYVAVIALPDPIITMTSVTGDLTATALVHRLVGRGRAPFGDET